MNSDAREGIRAVTLAAIMVLSVIAMGVAFTGSAAGQQASAPTLDATTPTNGSVIHGETTFTFDASSADADLKEIQFDVYGPAAGSNGNEWVYDSDTDHEQFNLPANESLLHEAVNNPSTQYEELGGYSLNQAKTAYGFTGLSYDADEEKWSITVDTSNDFWSDGEWDWLVSVVDEDGDKSATNNFNEGSPDVRTYYVDDIQGAIDDATPDDTVEVTSGTYEGSITIDKADITLRGPNAGIDADDDNRGGEAVVNGQLSVSAQNVTVDGLQVSPGTNTFKSKPAAAIFVTASNASVRNNRVGDFTVNITDIDVNSVQGIQIYEEGTEVTGSEIRDNSISNITYDGSSLAPQGEWGTDYGQIYGVHVQGEIGSAVVKGNTLRNLESDGYIIGLAVSGTDSNPDASPDDVAIETNAFENFNSEGGYAAGVVVSSDRVNASNVSVTRNSFDVPVGVENGDDSSLNATNNWWGSANGPNTSASTYNAGNQGANVSSNVEFTPWLNESTDNGGQPFAPVVNSDTGEQFASIQDALASASSDESIYVQGGTYDEYVRFNADNVTLYSDEGATIAPTEETLDDNSRNRIVDTDGYEEALIYGISVDGPGTTTDDPVGITLTGVNASVQNVTVENVLTGIQTSSGGSDGATIHNVTVDTVSVGVSIQSNDTVLSGSTIKSASTEGVGIVDGRDKVYVGNNDFTDISGPLIKLYNLSEGTDSTVTVEYNNLSAGKSAIVNEDTGNVYAVLNWFGSDDGPSENDINGSVEYDPYLTAAPDEVDDDNLEQLPTSDSSTSEPAASGSTDDGSTDDGSTDDEPTESEPTDDVPDAVSEIGATPTNVEQVTPAVDRERGVTVATFESTDAVAEVALETTSSVEDVTVSELDPAATEADSSPGRSLALQDISVPADVEDTPATIEFSVPASTLESADTSAENLRVFRRHDGTWNSLPTRVVEETDEGVVLEAETPGFSLFAVSSAERPEASIDLDATTAAVGEEIELSGAESSDPDGEIASYEWTVDGASYSGETTTLSLDAPGEYTVELTVTDGTGETDTVTRTLSVEQVDDATATAAAVTDQSTPAGPTQETGGFDLALIVATLLVLVAGILAYRRT